MSCCDWTPVSSSADPDVTTIVCASEVSSRFPVVWRWAQRETNCLPVSLSIPRCSGQPRARALRAGLLRRPCCAFKTEAVWPLCHPRRLPHSVCWLLSLGHILVVLSVFQILAFVMVICHQGPLVRGLQKDL